MRWKVYYDDGSTYSSEDGAWSDAPPDGVLFVVYWVDGVKTIFSGADHYYFHDGVVAATNDLGPLLRKLGIVKFGRWTSHKRMEAAAALVRADD